MVASVSSTPFTSFFAISFSTAIFSISCDFVICTAILRPLCGDSLHKPYLESSPQPMRWPRLVNRNLTITADFGGLQGDFRGERKASPSFSAIIMVGMLVFAVGRRGITD